MVAKLKSEIISLQPSEMNDILEKTININRILYLDGLSPSNNHDDINQRYKNGSEGDFFQISYLPSLCIILF